jgi:hypothetical protein
MKKLFLIIALILISNDFFSQTKNYPKGAYFSFEEIINKNSSNDYNVEVEQRSNGKIKMNGGNDYQLNSIDKSVKRKFLRNELYAYSDGKELYINCFKYKLQLWYSKILSESDNYFIFKAAIPQNPKDYGIKNSEISNMFGLVGGVMSGMKLAMLRFPYVMNKTDQKITLVTENNIQDLIGNNTELLSKYENEKDKGNVDIILKYLSEWNKTE